MLILAGICMRSGQASLRGFHCLSYATEEISTGGISAFVMNLCESLVSHTDMRVTANFLMQDFSKNRKSGYLIKIMWSNVS